VCRAWSGVIYSITGNTKGYPSYADAVGAGVWHPNCVCVPRYVDELIDGDALAAQKGTPNPEAPTKDEWNDYARRIEQEARPEIGIRRPLTPALKDPPKVDLAASAPAFVPAKTVKEAEEYATKTLGVKGINIEVGNESLDAINRVNAGLLRLKSSGEDLSGLKISIKDEKSHHAGRYLHFKGELSINPKRYGRTNAEIKEFAEKNFRTGYLSTGDIDGIVIHEYGHRKHALHNKELRDAAREKKIPQAKKNILKRNVSRYSGTNPSEMVAEVFAGLSTGKKYGPKVMTLYKSYGGPDWTVL
jgi:hypothetical protein